MIGSYKQVLRKLEEVEPRNEQPTRPPPNFFPKIYRISLIFFSWYLGRGRRRDDRVV